MSDLTLTTFRGGVNTTDPPSELDKDQCVVMDNVELHLTSLGGKRKGHTPIDLGTANAFADTDMDAVTFLFRHLPSDDQTAAELWALTQSLDASDYALMRKTTVWSEITPFDDIVATTGLGLRMSAVSFHNKLFLGFKSDENRLHVWDGTSLRRAGLRNPDSLSTPSNTGSGTFSGNRYYRIRWTVQSSGVTILRSEPSDVAAFVPSGSGSAARITKPGSNGESHTHWEVEASINNADFYRIATVVTATSTYDDTIAAYTVGYAATGTLSEQLENYELPYSAEFLVVDEDRLVLGSSFDDDTMTSRVSWTPVFNDPGVGNDERIPLDPTSYLDLDSTDGGGLTGLSRPIQGSFYAFKRSAIYQLTRSGIRSHAYDVVCLTKEKGALKGSIVNAVDQSGNPCVYFMDPVLGPCRLGRAGLQICSWDILDTFRTINLGAVRVCHGLYFPHNRQIRYWLATDDEDYPNFMLVVHLNQIRDDVDGARKGWVTWSTGRSTTALCSCLFSDNIDDDTARSLDLVPFIGLATDEDDDRSFIMRGDIGYQDNEEDYTSLIMSAPFSAGNLLDKTGIMSAALIAEAATDVRVSVRIIINFGLDEGATVYDIDLSPEGSEEQVIRFLDNLSGSDIRMVQFEFGDLTNPTGLWGLNQFVARLRKEDEA